MFYILTLEMSKLSYKYIYAMNYCCCYHYYYYY